MSSDKNTSARLFCLWASVSKMVVDGKRNAEKVADLLQQIVDERGPNFFVRQIATGVLKATTGERALVNAHDIFTGYLDPNFKNWKTDIKGEPTEEANFEVFELVKSGTFNQIFEAFGVDLDKLCWSQDQIITFAENHADLLHPEGYATFFLFQAGNEFFVASVRRGDDGQLLASVGWLSGDVWDAEVRRRFVVPQQVF